jgi:putative transposase
VTIDKSGANTAALATLNTDKSKDQNITVRQSKYLYKRAEQNHRNNKRRIHSMLFFKSLGRAQTLFAVSN